MTAIAFDTLAYSKKLQAAGMPATQADAFAEAQQDAIRHVIDAKELATKGDLLTLRQDLLTMRKDIVEEMGKQKVELIKWVIGLLIAQSGLFMGLMYFLHQKP